MHNLQDKCQIPNYKNYLLEAKHNFISDFIQTFSDLEHDRLIYLKKQEQLIEAWSKNNSQISGRRATLNLKPFVNNKNIENYFNVSQDYSQDGQSRLVEKFYRQYNNFLNLKEGGLANTDSLECGTFVEVGAADGQDFSNTLYLENKLNWHGYLIEANHDLYKKLISENIYRPNSIKINACVGPVNAASTTVDLPFNFQPLGLEKFNFIGGISIYLEMYKNTSLRQIYESHFGGRFTDIFVKNPEPGSEHENGDSSAGTQNLADATTQPTYDSKGKVITCINLEKLLPQNMTIDYLSLDTEGSELPILESVSQEFLGKFVKILSVDVSSAGGSEVQADNSQRIQKYLEKLDFTLIFSLKHDDIYMNVNLFDEEFKFEHENHTRRRGSRPVDF